MEQITNVEQAEYTRYYLCDGDNRRHCPLRFYKAITKYAGSALKPGGKIYFEINSRFGNDTMALLSDDGFHNAEIIKDMYGLDRFVKAIKNDEP